MRHTSSGPSRDRSGWPSLGLERSCVWTAAGDPLRLRRLPLRPDSAVRHGRDESVILPAGGAGTQEMQPVGQGCGSHAVSLGRLFQCRSTTTFARRGDVVVSIERSAQGSSPARNSRVERDSPVTWFSGSAPGGIGSRSHRADSCWAGAAHDRERDEQERQDRSPPNRRNGEAPYTLPPTLRAADADRLERSGRASLRIDQVRS